MAKKKQKEAEHVNLERWMVSYSDFVTLLFATFVVLYALSQVDIQGFQEVEKSIKEAFAAPSLMQGSDGVMQKSGANTLFDSSQADALVAPLMMEYMSQKYEEESMTEIEKEINNDAKSGELSGVKAIKTDKGLLIRFSNDLFFKSNSAELPPEAKKNLDKVGVLILKKFVLHSIRVEGHTDKIPVKSAIFPSNWELSSARASAVVRYFIERHKFMPALFSAVGLADTRPLEKGNSPSDLAKNRRVEILILKNRFRAQESSENIAASLTKVQQEQIQAQRLDAIRRVGGMSEAAQKLSNGDRDAESSTVILNQAYNTEIKRLSNQTGVLEQKVKNKATGGADWLRPPASSEVDAFKKSK